MSMLKSSVAKVVAAAVAMTAGTAAFAATGPNEGPSDLFIAVWNPSTSTSYVQDLGSGFSFSNLDTGGSFNTAGFTTSTAVDGGNLSSVLGAGTYSFSLFAGNGTPSASAFNNYLGDTVFLSETAGHAIVPLTNSGAFTNAMGTLATYIDTNMSGSTQSFTAHDTGDASSKYWAAASNPNSPGNPGHDFQLPGYPGDATAGSAGLELVKYFAPTSGSDSGSDPTTASFVGANGNAGVFTLNSTGVLTYSAGGAVSGVPLPAAAWLLVSGLLGLGAVGRRKAAAAV